VKKILPLLVSLLCLCCATALPGGMALHRTDAKASVHELPWLRKILRPIGTVLSVEKTSAHGSAVRAIFRCRVLRVSDGEECQLLVKFLDGDAPTVRRHFPRLGEVRELAANLRLRPGDGVEVPLLEGIIPCCCGNRAYLVVQDFGGRTALRSVLRSNRIDLARRRRAMATLGSALAHFHLGNRALVTASSPQCPLAPRHGDLNFNNFIFSSDRRNVFFIDTVGLQLGPCGDDIADVVYAICRDYVTGAIGRGEEEGQATLADCKSLVAAFLQKYRSAAADLLDGSAIDLQGFTAAAAAAGMERLVKRMEREPEELYGPVNCVAGPEFLAGYAQWIGELAVAN
jgi:hypothetical protein